MASEVPVPFQTFLSPHPHPVAGKPPGRTLADLGGLLELACWHMGGPNYWKDQRRLAKRVAVPREETGASKKGRNQPPAQ